MSRPPEFSAVPARVVVFDVDGTLVSDDLHRQKHNHILRALCGSNHLDIGDEEWSRLRGLSDTDTHAHQYAKAKKHGFDAAKIKSADDYISEAETYFYEHLDDIEMREGAQDIVAIVRELGCIAGIATNADRQETDRKLAFVGLQDEFRFFSCLDGVIAPKPAPDLFHQAVLQAAQVIGKPLSPSEVVVIEDSVTGATGALRAGCRVIWWQPEMAGDQSLPADVSSLSSLARLTIVRHPQDVIDLLRMYTHPLRLAV